MSDLWRQLGWLRREIGRAVGQGEEHRTAAAYRDTDEQMPLGCADVTELASYVGSRR